MLSGCNANELPLPPISADADTDGGAGGPARKGAGERSGHDYRGGREHGPDQDTGLCVADIDAEFGDVADVMLIARARPGERAIQRARGAEHESEAARHIAGQGADHDAALGLRRSGQRQDRAERRRKAHGEPHFHRHDRFSSDGS